MSIGVTANSRAEVDDLTDRAVAAGGAGRVAQDLGYMYMRAFLDLDGHRWSFMHLSKRRAKESAWPLVFAAATRWWLDDEQRHNGLTNRAENSRLPTRKRDRVLQRFKSALSMRSALLGR